MALDPIKAASYLSDELTQELSPMAEFCRFRLRMHQEAFGGLPDDIAYLASCCRLEIETFELYWSEIRNLFTPLDGLLYDRLLLPEIEEDDRARKFRHDRARKAALIRHGRVFQEIVEVRTGSSCSVSEETEEEFDATSRKIDATSTTSHAMSIELTDSKACTPSDQVRINTQETQIDATSNKIDAHSTKIDANSIELDASSTDGVDWEINSSLLDSGKRTIDPGKASRARQGNNPNRLFPEEQEFSDENSCRAREETGKKLIVGRTQAKSTPWQTVRETLAIVHRHLEWPEPSEHDVRMHFTGPSPLRELLSEHEFSKPEAAAALYIRGGQEWTYEYGWNAVYRNRYRLRDAIKGRPKKRGRPAAAEPGDLAAMAEGLFREAFR